MAIEMESIATPDVDNRSGVSHSQSVSPKRFASVDTFRGLVMANLVFVQPLIPAVASLPPGPARDFLNQQLHHSPWHGLTKADVTFAAFVIMLGMMIPLSLRRKLVLGQSRIALYRRIGTRSLLLFALGVLCNGGFASHWPDIRLAGVLQRLAICYLAGALLYMALNTWLRAALVLIILFGYWAILALVPVPGGYAGDLSFDHNLAAWVDGRFLPGRAWFGTWDPEGILSTMPAIGSCLLGTLAGDLLLTSYQPSAKALIVAVAGLVAVNLGFIWDGVFPINKSLWTSSFVLATGGIVSLIFATCCLLTDVLQKTSWAFPLIVIGRNPLLAYLISVILPLGSVAERLVGGDIAGHLGYAAPWVAGLVEGALLWLFLYWLYRNGLMVRL